MLGSLYFTGGRDPNSWCTPLAKQVGIRKNHLYLLQLHTAEADGQKEEACIGTKETASTVMGCNWVLSPSLTASCDCLWKLLCFMLFIRFCQAPFKITRPLHSLSFGRVQQVSRELSRRTTKTDMCGELRSLWIIKVLDLYRGYEPAMILRKGKGKCILHHSLSQSASVPWSYWMPSETAIS